VFGEQYTTIEVYNIRGQLVKTLANGTFKTGLYNVVWNGKDESDRKVSSGIYFYKMKTDDYSSIKKMILLK
jgi:flagellar hook assembly protein FlgD